MNAITKSWIPSVGGLLTFAGVLIAQLMKNFDDNPATNADWMMVLAALGTMLGLASARQSNVSDEQAGAGNDPNAAPGKGASNYSGKVSTLILLTILTMGLISHTVQADPPPASLSTTLLGQQPLSPPVEKPAARSAAKPSASSAAVAIEKMKARRPDNSFRDALIEAAEQARRDGEITRWELASIKIATWRHPDLVRECQDCVMEEATAAGLAAGPDGAFDWMAIIDFIKALLPLILQIISLFSSADAGLPTGPFGDIYIPDFSLAA